MHPLLCLRHEAALVFELLLHDGTVNEVGHKSIEGPLQLHRHAQARLHLSARRVSQPEDRLTVRVSVRARVRVWLRDRGRLRVGD